MPPRTKSSGLFTVFQDENTQDAPASSSNRAGSSQSRKEQPSQGKLQPRSKPSAAATSRKALGNKENKPVASSQARASRVFGGKQPFTDASPVKPHSRESAQQPLGALPSCQTKKNTQSQARGFTVLRGGDPVKKSSKSLAVSKLGLANSRMQQHRLNKAALELDQPSAATTLEDQSPVLANISEAFSGQGGFHWSPSASHIDSACLPAPLDTPSGGSVRVLRDASDPDYADDPHQSTVVLTGSPIKKRRAVPPSNINRLRALRC